MIAAARIRSSFPFFPLTLTLLLALAVVTPATATLYVLVADEDLAMQADVIVEARVSSVDSAPGTRPATDAILDVDKVIHGFVPASSLVVRSPGGVTADGQGLYIYGAPRFREGERLLLLLRARQDGTYAVLHFNQGAFRIVEYQGQELAVRDLSEAERVDPQGRKLEAPTQVRNLERFANFLAGRAAGRTVTADTGDYFTDVPYEAVLPRLPRFNSMQDGDGTPLRWTNFDSGGQVTFFAHVDGQNGISGGGFNEFRAALRAWTNDPSSFVQLRYGGTTAATGGLQNNDGINAILFDNKDGGADFDSPFSCAAGGTLALGGPWYRRQVHTHRGTRYYTIANADIVMNIGVSCYVGINRRGEQVFAHELGHCLGIGHSCGDERTGPCNTNDKNQALMRANAHNDNRGARLDNDDKLAVCTIYGNGSCGGGPPPPTNLQVTLLETGEVQLTWEDNASDESAYRVEARPAGGAFSTLASLPANTTSHVLSDGLTPGVEYTFRVRAVGSGGTAASNQVTLLFPQVDPPVAPSDLIATGTGIDSVRLQWTDNADNELHYEIEAQIGDPLGSAAWHGDVESTDTPDKAFSLLGSADADSTSTTLSGLDPYTLYTFRVRAIGAGGGSGYTGQAATTTWSNNGTAPAGPSELLVIPTSSSSVQVTWQDNASNEIEHQVDMSRDGEPYERVGEILRDRIYLDVDGLEPGVRYIFRARARSAAALSSFSDSREVTLPLAGDPCVASGDVTCLLSGRFRVEVQWRNPRNGKTGRGNADPVSDQGSTFWFFSSDNTELIVKMIDGRGNNGHFWVFYGALSDVEYWVTVTDTETGEVKTYRNDFGNICGLADTTALTGEAPSDSNSLLTGTQVPVDLLGDFGTALPTTATDKDGTACGGDANSLCLLGDRVRVDVTFAAPNGQAGPATPVPSTDRTGLFWFFRASNLELVVKALDGSNNNGHLWIFWGALTNVEYQITVTDTVTGTTKTYENEQGNVCGGADIKALPVS